MIKVKCPRCHRESEYEIEGRVICSRCNRDFLILPDSDENFYHIIVNLKLKGWPLEGDIFVEKTEIFSSVIKEVLKLFRQEN